MYRKVFSIVICAMLIVAIYMMILTMENVSAQVTEEWIAKYNGPGDDNDYAQDIAVDSSGNVYVTGFSIDSVTSKDYVTIKYDTDGNELWVARYNGPANDIDEAKAIAIDSTGNVYVTGKSDGNGSSADYATIMYDFLGNEKWVARYNGPGNDIDRSRDIALDSFGNVYVTGPSKDSTGFYDYATIKYDSNGTQIWVKRYNGFANGNDVAWALAVDSSKNVYVTGHEEILPGDDSSNNYATVAYDLSGNFLWVERYNGPGNDADEAEFMTLDSSGNIYVTGKSKGIGTHFDYATIKYDLLGNELWVSRYNGPKNEFEYAFAIASDSYGNIYVTGRENLDSNPNYATIAYNSSGGELWVARYDGPGNGNDMARDLAIDQFGNVYVTGDSVGSGTSTDFATVAYDSNGTELWVMRYNDPGNGPDAGTAIATDPSGNVYVTGTSYSNGIEPDYCTIKYSQVFSNQPPVADAGPDQAVNKGDVVEFNGSASYDPDGTILTYEWDFDLSDGLWWETGAPSDAFGPNSTYTYNDYGVYTATLIVTDNNGSKNIDTCEITVLFPSPPPPTLYINVSQDKEDIILYWDPPSTLGLNHYLIYRSTSQTDFDFSNVWVNTSSNNESGEPGPIPLRSMWNDTNAALPGDPNYEKEYYYIIRAVNNDGEVSRTSRTVGKWTKKFPNGVSTFSLPLKPLGSSDTDWYTSSMKAEYIKYMNTTTHTWMHHNFGDRTKNNTQMKLGEGYEVKFGNQTNYTFTGMPGAMISYDDVSFGFNTTPGTGNANNLTTIVNNVSSTVTLNWTQPIGMGSEEGYYVLRSNSRDGFWGTLGLNFTQLAVLPFDVTSFQDIGNATTGAEYYYMIVPVNLSTGERGVSTYSIGIWIEEYLPQYDTFGIPLKLNSFHTTDWYCNNIPYTVGINYYIYSQQRWSWHSTLMPEGAFDPLIEIAAGYQISTSVTTEFTFIGI